MIIEGKFEVNDQGVLHVRLADHTIKRKKVIVFSRSEINSKCDLYLDIRRIEQVQEFD